MFFLLKFKLKCFNSIPFQITVIPCSKYCGLSVYATSFIENKLQRSREKCIHFRKFNKKGGMKRSLGRRTPESMRKSASKIGVFLRRHK